MVSGNILAAQPNIIFVLTDDLGYGDLGVLFQKSREEANVRSQPWTMTPCLDRFAAEGAQLPSHYCAAPVCAPSRASILSGLSQGHANVRDNQFDKGLANNHTLASVLKQAGYATVAVGKWGMQGIGREEKDPATWPAFPTKRGFDCFFGYARHMDGHEHYPKEALYAMERKPKQVWDGTNDITSGLDKCYTADLWTAWTKHWIVEHERTNSAQPFFIYLAYDTPHAATELPTMAYPEGGGLHGGMEWLGTPGHMINTASGKVDSWMHPDYRHATYDDDNNPATPEVSWKDVDKRYATAVRRLDSAVGDIQKLLQDLHIDGDTMVIFSSDNGPSIESYLPHEPLRADFFDSFGPFDGIKRDCWEGGVRVPTLVRWPGHIPAGLVVKRPSISYDWLPTLAEAAGIPAPANADGVSLLPELTGKGRQRDGGYLYVEYFENGRTPNYSAFTPSHRDRQRGQMQFIRLGDHVGVRYNVKSAADPFEIYQADVDTHEATNLAAQMPVLEQQMKSLVLQVRRPNSSAPRPYDNTPVPASTNTVFTNGVVNYAVFEGQWPWVPDFGALTPLRQGRATGLDLAVRPRDENFGIAFTGFITVPGAGDYTFTLKDDAGANFRINDATVIDDDFNHTGEAVSATICLAAGRHAFRLYYRHGIGPRELSLSYTGPGIARQEIPLCVFSLAGTADPLPQAANDFISTPQNTPVLIPVLANDTDAGPPLSVNSLVQPQDGAVSKAGNLIRYAPRNGFVGNDSFRYTITDGIHFATATVTVQVSANNGGIWLPFDESSGLETRSATNDFIGRLTGFTDERSEWVAGIRNHALEFNGEGESVTITGSFLPPSGRTSRTTTAWIKTRSDGAILGWGPNNTSQKWIMRIEDDPNCAGVLRVEVGGGYVRGTKDLRDGEWHCVAAVLPSVASPDTSDIRLFVDGISEPVSNYSPAAIYTAAEPVTIGVDSQDRYFKGVIDEVHIYNHALTDIEIASLYSENRSMSSRPAASLNALREQQNLIAHKLE